MADGPSKDAPAGSASSAAPSAAASTAASSTAVGWWGSLLLEVQGGLSEFVTVVTQDTRAQAEKVERTIEQLQERSVPANQIASELVNTVTRGIGRLLADDSPDSSRTATPARGEVQYVVRPQKADSNTHARPRTPTRSCQGPQPQPVRPSLLALTRLRSP